MRPRGSVHYHERDQETGYDNRGARLYDSEIGRFLGVDPLAGKFAPFSPYNYVLGNPVSLVDPDGQEPSPPYTLTRSYRTVEYQGGGTHVVSRNTHRRVYHVNNQGEQTGAYTESVSISSVTVKVFSPTVESGFSQPTVFTSSVTHNAFEIQGLAGGEQSNGLVLQDVQVYGRMVDPGALSEEGTSSIDAQNNATLKSDAQGLVNFLVAGGDGNGFAGTPLTQSGSFSVNPKAAAAKGVASLLINKAMGTRTPIQTVAVGVLVSTQVDLINEFQKIQDNKPERHIGRIGVDNDTGWINQNN